VTPPTRPTIRDVAARAGVSKSLVSLALRGDPHVSETSREAILAAVAELGYRPNAAARTLADRRSTTIGVLILDLHNPVFAEILDGVQTEVRRRGFSTMLITGGTDPVIEQAEIDTLLQFRIEGLLLISHRLTEAALRSISTEVPTVVVTRADITGSRLDTVCNDDVTGAGLGIDHLVALGHTRITHLSGGDNPVAQARERGYREAMTRHGLAEHVSVIAGGLTDGAGHRAAQRALEDRPTALLVANDIGALGAIAAVEEAGLRVPDDISVVGYDGIALGALRNVNLTTIAQPLAELGERAAQQLFTRIEHPRARPRSIRVDSHLVIRGTTAAPPATQGSRATH